MSVVSSVKYYWAITPLSNGGAGYDPSDSNLKPHLDKLAWAGLSQGDFLIPPNVSINSTPAWADLVNSNTSAAQEVLDVLQAEFQPNYVFSNQSLIKGKSMQSCP